MDDGWCPGETVGGGIEPCRTRRTAGDSLSGSITPGCSAGSVGGECRSPAGPEARALSDGRTRINGGPNGSAGYTQNGGDWLEIAGVSPAPTPPLMK